MMTDTYVNIAFLLMDFIFFIYVYYLDLIDNHEYKKANRMESLLLFFISFTNSCSNNFSSVIIARKIRGDH